MQWQRTQNNVPGHFMYLFFESTFLYKKYLPSV